MNHNSTRVWTFIIAATIITYSACRKNDQITEPQNAVSKHSLIENKFFNSSRTTNPTEKALVDFLKSKNDQKNFVEQTVKQIGYPRWDKTIMTTTKNVVNTNTTLTGNNGQPIPGHANVVPQGNDIYKVEITLNPSFFQTTTKEWVAAIILHELLHGIIRVERPYLNTSGDQHIWMFDNKAPITIAHSLTQLFPGIDAHHAIALGMGGMSEGYTIPNTNIIDPLKEAFCIANYYQNLNQAISTESNYQNAVFGFGTPFC